jgi:hypothetical protein
VTLAEWPVTFAGGREEDEVLLEWLKSNLADLSTEEKRAAVRRLSEEFGYTVKGLMAELNLSESTVRYLRSSDEAYARHRVVKRDADRRNPRVRSTNVLRLVDRWQERAGSGLSAEEAALLLAEIRALVPTPSPKGTDR